MSISLKNACFDIWRTNYERKGIRDKFIPIFTRYIGVENPTEYDDVLKTLITKAQEDSEHCIYFDSQIPMSAEFDLINSIKQELSTMDVTKLSTQDIQLFDDSQINKIFLESLEYTVDLALKQENFMNNSIRNNFICKLILYSYLHIHNIKFENQTNPKCIYYGDISKHDIYFLIMLYRMTFDILYINPLKDEFWEQIDTNKLSSLHKNKQILPVKTLNERLQDGKILEVNQSMTLQFEQQIEEQLFANSGIYRPWQFRDGDTVSIFFNSSLIDVEANWKEPAKVRQGFKTTGKKVFIPHFFYEVEGEYKDLNEYVRLVHTCTESSNTFLITDDGKSLITNKQEENARFQLMFCQLSDGTFDIEQIKKLPFYTLSSYKEETQNFILNKINETIKDLSLFKDPLDTNEEKCHFTMLVLELDKTVIRLIDNFDFTNDIPKITIFLDNEQELDENTALILGYLNEIGFDIIIFTPAALSGLNKYVETSRYNTTRLDTINYTRTLDSLNKIKEKKKGFLEKIFG